LIYNGIFLAGDPINE